MDSLVRSYIERSVAELLLPYTGQVVTQAKFDELNEQVKDFIRTTNTEDEKIAFEFARVPTFTYRIIFPDDVRRRAYEVQLADELQRDDPAARARGQITFAMVMACIPTRHRVSMTGRDITEMCRALNRMIEVATEDLPEGIHIHENQFVNATDAEPVDINSLDATALMKLARFRTTHEPCSEKVPR